MKLDFMRIAASTIVVIASITLFLSNANSQPDSSPLPVILIHGYRQDASVWQTWEDLLESDGIPHGSITFVQSDDDCGSAKDHAMELRHIVQNVLLQTGSEQINIVGHSKGGLDARVYLQSGTDDVANLIMIGTPNDGSPLADIYNDTECMPAAADLKRGSSASRANENTNTDYHTISGDWRWGYPWFLINGNLEIPGPDDGWVPVASVESLGYADILGRTDNEHANLLGAEEYDLARGVLLR